MLSLLYELGRLIGVVRAVNVDFTATGRMLYVQWVDATDF